ncbi:tyrosine-type recombinase/integrase [Bradyrhizobium sp. LA2.1]|uniref:tyrosine-type recombinase/integrase n=1 Tax=Bradyrhizobium sp. LA2.1 TaxID=3156376 RepID=UPI003393B79A
MPDYLTKRNGYWQYHRRVPKAFAGLGGKSKFIVITTKIPVAEDRSGSKAARVAARLNEQQEAHWRSLASGTPGKQRWRDAVTIARSMGVDYLTPDEAARRDIGELLTRIETLNVGDRKTDVAVVDAVLGAVEKPKVMLSDLFTEYEKTQQTPLSKMSPDQRRKWTSAKKRAVEILIEQRGNKALQDLTRADAVAYADYWEGRTIAEGISPNSANKNISHIGGMIKAVNKRLALGLDSVFSGTRIDGGRDGSRAPFTVDHIRKVILAPDALDGLNDEARDVIYVAMETGCRPSEIVNLSKGRIKLGTEIPYIRVEAEGRLLKTEHSERDIPLVGMALEAMKRHPAGFPRYHDRGSTLSATLMKHMKARKLLPTDRHSVYSFRHAFKDRLKAAECPEEMVDELMGHATGKPKYGDGYGLQLKAKYLQAIALTVG